jgi:hypothetical protein
MGVVNRVIFISSFKRVWCHLPVRQDGGLTFGFVTRYGVTELIWDNKPAVQGVGQPALKWPFSDHFATMLARQSRTIPSWFLPAEGPALPARFFARPLLPQG